MGVRCFLHTNELDNVLVFSFLEMIQFLLTVIFVVLVNLAMFWILNTGGMIFSFWFLFFTMFLYLMTFWFLGFGEFPDSVGGFCYLFLVIVDLGGL